MIREYTIVRSPPRLPAHNPAPAFYHSPRRTRPETPSRIRPTAADSCTPLKERGQNRCRPWPSRARGRNAPGPVSRPYRSVRLSDRRYATDRDLTREMPLVVPRDQRNHFLPPVMTTVFPSGCGGRGFRLQPRHLEYRLYDLAILVNSCESLPAGIVRSRIRRIRRIFGIYAHPENLKIL